jgi:hypothetical protein
VCLAACSRPIHWLIKPQWQCCFLGSDNGGGSAFVPTCVSMVLELDDGQWLRWLQKS